MFKKLLSCFLGLVLVITVKAQYPNYAFQAVSGTYTNITGTSATLTASCSSATDEGFANGIPIGFPFNYNGTVYNTINVSTDGFATFGANLSATGGNNATACAFDNNGTGLTSYAGSRPILAPFWDDLDMTGGVQYTTTGSTPNRVFTLQFKQALWDYSAASPSLSFQIKLYETTNILEFVYNQEVGITASTSGGASIGITSTATGSGSFLSLSDASAAPLTSFTTETKTIATRPATGQIYRWIPYCTPTITNVGASEDIRRVQFGTIDNTSPAGPAVPAYENFTLQSTTVQSPSSVPITITLDQNGYAQDSVKVWIDFNHNGSFADPGELVFQGKGITSTGNIAIPALSANVLLGPTRMRVRLDDSGSPPTNTTACGNSTYGQTEDYTVILSLCTPASISVQPPNVIVCNGGNGTISLTASGTALTYQWQISTNGGTTWTNIAPAAPYSGVTTNTLTITGVTTAMDNNQFRVLLNGQCTPANTPSNAATLKVNSPTAITTQPVATQACAGTNTSFTIAASNNATYQWQVSTDGGLTYSDIAGATSGTLPLTAVTNSMNGNRYRAIATVQSCNSVTSAAVILTVNALPSATLTVGPLTKLYPTLTTILSASVTPAAAGNTFTWYKNGVAFSFASASASSQTVDVDAVGNWTVKVTDAKGCVSPLSNTVTISDSIINKLFLYPNPSRGLFYVRYFTEYYGTIPDPTINMGLIRNVVVTDSKGLRLFDKKITASRSWSAMPIDLRGYGKGVYFIDVRDVDGRRLVVGKAVVQ